MRFIPVAGSIAVACTLLTGLFLAGSGCTSPSSGNLTGAELRENFLAHAITIHDYRAEFERRSPLGSSQPFIETFQYGMKSPALYRMECISSPQYEPGSFWTENGTTRGWFDASTKTYDISGPPGFLASYDYQAMVRAIVQDYPFIITGRETLGGHSLYTIEARGDLYKYTGSVSSRLQAAIDPETGLAWHITTYYPEDTVNADVRFTSIGVNTGIPDTSFSFEPPPGTKARCDPKYQDFVLPEPADTSVPVSEPLAGVRYSLDENDSGRTVTLHRGEILELTLRAIPGLAYRWLMPVNGSGLELMNSGMFSEPPPDYHDTQDYPWFSNGKYRLRYRATGTGTSVFDGVFSLDGCDLGDSPRFNLTVNVV